MLSLYYIFVFLILVAIWLLILYVFLLAVQNNRYRKWLFKQSYVTLLLKVPKNNEKNALAAEQMYASLHGIYRNKWTRLKEGSLQEHISFEIVSCSKYIKFYVYVPEQLVEFVEGQLYAQYPTLLVERVKDYTQEFNSEGKNFSTCELVLEKEESYPIRTFESFEVDPLSAITAVLSKLGDTNNQIWVQYLIKPADNQWQQKSLRRAQRIKGELGNSSFLLGLWRMISVIFQHILTSGATTNDSGGEKKILSGPEQEAIKAIETKTTKSGYEVKIRILSFADSETDAKNKLQTIISTFKQFNLSNQNGFMAQRLKINNQKELDNYIKRSFWGRGYVLNTMELASLFHLPSITVATPAIVWSMSKVSEPPSDLPTVTNSDLNNLTVFGKTNFRGVEDNFGILTEDRSRHMYIVGKTGMGKTSLLQNMAIDDVRKGRGLAIIDPHGDFVDTVMNYIPAYRINDVVLFDAGDRDNPIAFNLLEQVEDDYKPIIASGLIAIFKKLWHDSWGPRLEHILRYTFLALLDYPGSTFLSVPRILTDESFRKMVVDKIKDPVVRDFWQTEYEGYPDKLKMEAISPIQNKIGQFLASTTIRNIVGQPVTSMNMREIMDKKKILLVKVSKGLVGEDNAALLGAMMITKVQLAAMSRADIPMEQRIPFNLYVDEFQNFATESFASILSEARKYNLNLHVANQYIAQMEDIVREAVFGNVGTLITFRVGATDADYLAKEFAPTFTGEDITNLEKFHIYLRMTIKGISSPAFSATTLNLPKNKTNTRDKVVKVSRERYSTSRDFVEQKIQDWTQGLDKIKESNSQKKENAKKQKQFYKNQNRFGQQFNNNEQVVLPSPEDQKKNEQLLNKLKTFQSSRQQPLQIEEKKSEIEQKIQNEPKEYVEKIPVEKGTPLNIAIGNDNPIADKVVAKDIVEVDEFAKKAMERLKNWQKGKMNTKVDIKKKDKSDNLTKSKFFSSGDLSKVNKKNIDLKKSEIVIDTDGSIIEKDVDIDDDFMK